jgi:hypothetical protein
MIVPDRRKLRRVNVVCVIVLACTDGNGGKEGQWGQVKDLIVGQLTLSMGPARVKVCTYVQGATIPSKRVVFILKYSQSTTHAIINIMCPVPKENIFSPLQV